eukprot:GHRQ01027604.1.p1 GENE.GHRQ01027604.1~~GHRQ01027604.1.p1  ORF type:complete len:191 (+),score=56.59 GHRQ01027604.1:411-983(+)
MAFTTSNALRTTAPVGHRHSPARSLRHVTLRKPCSPMGWCPQHGSSRHSSQWQQQQPRLQAAAVAEAAQLGGQLAEGVGVLGIGAAGLFVALWNTEKSAKAGVEQDLQQTKEQVAALQQELEKAQQQLEEERQARKEAESWRRRLDAAEKELFKLERGLEMKDGQLATFMTTAHRQIKSLEDTVKELQKF